MNEEVVGDNAIHSDSLIITYETVDLLPNEELRKLLHVSIY